MIEIDKDEMVKEYCDNCRFKDIHYSNISNNYEIKYCLKEIKMPNGELILRCVDCVQYCDIIILNQKLKKIRNAPNA